MHHANGTALGTARSMRTLGLSNRSRAPRPPFVAPVCATILILFVVGTSSRKTQSAQALNPDSAYFPPESDHSFAPLFAEFLAAVDEPSLISASYDSTVVTYRSNSFGFKTGLFRSTRLSVNPGGMGRVFVTLDYGNPRKVHRKQGDVSAAEVRTFLELVEKSDFWTMSAAEQDERDSPVGRQLDKLDRAVWCIEGVRKGSYHAVQRRNTAPGSFTEMVDFLEKTLASHAKS